MLCLYRLHFNYTVNSTVSGHRQYRVNFRKIYLFFRNDTVFRYFDYPVIFRNLLDAWNMMLAVETWLIEVFIKKCLTSRFTGKWKSKYQQIIYMLLLKLQIGAAISAKHVLSTYTFVDNLQLTKIENRFLYFSNFFMTHFLISLPSLRTTNTDQPLGLPQKFGCLGKMILIEHYL